MNFDDVSDAMMLIYDTLRDDEESESLIEKIDEAESDNEIIEGIKEAIDRLRIVNPAVAKEVEKKTKSFMV